jgi:alpha-tubulin suppressor-like RCC1 family protein
VAAGGSHTCASKTDGSLWCWGGNGGGQLGDGTTTDKPSPIQVNALGMAVAAVAAGSAHTGALKTDGSLWCWGGNTWGQLGDGTTVKKSSPTQVPALGTAVAAVAAGSNFIGDAHTCARKTEGSLWCWGDNIWGQLGDGTKGKKSSPTQVFGWP